MPLKFSWLVYESATQFHEPIITPKVEFYTHHYFLFGTQLLAWHGEVMETKSLPVEGYIIMRLEMSTIYFITHKIRDAKWVSIVKGKWYIWCQACSGWENANVFMRSWLSFRSYCFYIVASLLIPDSTNNFFSNYRAVKCTALQMFCVICCCRLEMCCFCIVAPNKACLERQGILPAGKTLWSTPQASLWKDGGVNRGKDWSI